MKIKINKTFIIQAAATLALFILVLVLSLVFYNKKDMGKKRFFIFPSADSGEFVVEYRYLNEKPVQGEINLYVDEILLGSGIERTKKLFTSGTKVISCFQRDKVLYLDLSKDLLKKGTDVIDIPQGIELLTRNIKENFDQIDEVVVFVAGEQAGLGSWEL